MTLAIYISPNNGPIDLLPCKNDCSCVGNSFCMLNHINWTFGCKVTAGVWVAWSVGWLGRNLVSYVKLCMFIVPLFPALSANGFLADGTFQSRSSAPLLSLLCTQSSRELLSVAHPTVFPQFQSKIHPQVSTVLCNHTRPAFVFHSNSCFL